MMEWSLKVIFIWGFILLILRITHQAVNVALSGAAVQSSLLDPLIPPSVVIDGKPFSNYHHENQSCVSTLREDNPWWRLDMRGPYTISSIVIIRRSDCCIDELNGTEIRVGNSLENNGNNNPRCAVITVTNDTLMTFNCSQMEGRFVNIFLPGVTKILQLCEVKVFASIRVVGANMALRGVATLSAEPASNATSAHMAIDGYPGPGNPQETCASVQLQDNPSWQLDLKRFYRITAVSVISIGDCCSEELNLAEVRIGLKDDLSNQRCAIISVAEGQRIYNYRCGEMDGRFVHVVLPGLQKNLTVCEVRVYGNALDYCNLTSCSNDSIQIHNESKTWFEAQTYCRERYTDLATINNFQDMNRVTDKIQDLFYDYWIGLYEDDFTWKWSLSDERHYGDGEAVFRNWSVGEPKKSSNQRCAGIQHMGGWKDLDCNSLHYFLCFDGRDGAPETTILVKTPMKWTDAQRYCRENHTDLLSVRNQAENQEIQSVVPPGNLSWIGLFGDSWKWSDGSPSSFRQRWPLDSLEEGPNCAYVYDSKWSVKSCNTKSNFLCYYIRRKSVVRISAAFDLSDPVIQQQILNQLEAEMKNKGISNVKLHWRTSGRVTQEGKFKYSTV